MNRRYSKTYLDFKRAPATRQSHIGAASIRQPLFKRSMPIRRQASFGGFSSPRFSMPKISLGFLIPKSMPSGAALKRIALYGLAAFSIGFLWSHKSGTEAQINSTYESIAQDEAKLKANMQRTVASFEASAPEMIDLGIKFLQSNNFDMASIILNKASTIDPNMRDAFIYAGFSQIQLAIQNQEDPLQSQVAMQEAVKLLNSAAQVDPLHSYTFELMSYAYEFLGLEESSAQAKLKAQTVTLKN